MRLKKFDVVRIKAGTKPIGAHYVVSSSKQMVCYCNKLTDGSINEDKQYLFRKSSLEIIPCLKQRVPEKIISQIKESYNQVNLRLDYEKCSKLFGGEQMGNSNRIIKLHSNKDYVYIHFDGMVRTTHEGALYLIIVNARQVG